jgi:hypothetical protein
VKRIKPSGRGRRLGLAGILSAALLALLLTPALASAAHPSLGNFNAVAGHEPSFGIPRGSTVVQSTGDLLVIDSETKTVSRWKANGEADKFSALAANLIDGHTGEADETPAHEVVGSGSSEEMQVAVAPSTAAGGTAGDIYVTNTFAGVVDIFASTGAYLGELTGFGEATGVAVDSAGAVYVSSYEEGVYKFAPTANPVTNAMETALFSGVTEPAVLAAGAGPTAGYIFVKQWGNPGMRKIDSSSGAEQYSFGGLTNFPAVAIEPATGHVYLGDPGSDQFMEYDASGALESEVTLVSTTATAGPPTGIAVDKKSGHVYVSELGKAKLEAFDHSQGIMHVVLAGSGEGELSSVGGTFEGSPPIECSNISGEEKTGCETGLIEISPFSENISLEALPGPTSEFVEWIVEKGGPLFGCEELIPQEPFCTAGNYNLAHGEEVIVKVVFNAEPTPQPLTLTASGEGTAGTFECEDITAATAAAPCVSGATFPENDEVKVTTVDNPPSSVFSEFNTEEGAEACDSGSGNECVVTMSGPRAVNAKFVYGSVSFSATVLLGSGTVACEINNESKPCVGTYTYDDSVKVVATPNAENEVKQLFTSGSATCNALPPSESPATCEFTLTGTSSVEVEFVPAGTVKHLEPNVEGHVNLNTTLEWNGGPGDCEKGGSPNVNFGEFRLEEPREEYLVDCDLNVTTTGAETDLTAEDPSSNHKGHLIQEYTNGPFSNTYSLVEPLEMAASSAVYPSECNGTPQDLTAVRILCHYAEPANNDTVTASFIQWIEEHERLHTGTYAKEIILTLNQTTP